MATQDMTMIIRARNLSRKALGTVSSDLGRVSAQTAGVSRTMGTLATIGKASILGVGLAVGVTTAVAISSWNKFDKKMTESLAIMGELSDGTRNQMEGVARDVAKSTLISADQAAEAYFFLASAGLDAEQSMAALPQVAKFAQAGMFDMATATDLATDAQSALGLTVPGAAQNLENLTRVTDVLVKANTLANASVEQFSESLTNKAGAAAKVAGIEIEETVAVLAALADQGFKGRIAGDMYSRMLKGLQINAIKNEDAFERLGVNVFDVNGEMLKSSDIIGDLEGALGGLSDRGKTQALLDLGFSARQQDVFKVLLGTSEAIRQYETDLQSAGGVTDEVANNQMKSLSAQWTLFTSQIKDIFIGLGKKLMPVLLKIIEAMTKWARDVLPKVIKFLGDLVQVVAKHLVDAFKVLIGWVKGVVEWFNNLSPEWQTAIKFGGILTIGMIALAVAVSLVITSISPIVILVIAVIAAFALLAIGVRFLYEKFDFFKIVVDTVWDSIKTAIGGIVMIFHGLIDFIVGVFTGDWSRAWEGIKAIFAGVWNVLTTPARTQINLLKNLLSGVMGTIKRAWATAWSTMGAVVRGVWNGIKWAVKSSINAIIHFLNTLIRAFNTVAEYAMPLGFLPFVNVPNVPFIPHLGHGGTATRGGSAIVGDRGIELLHLPKGATVEPLAGGRRRGGGGGNNVTIVVAGGTTDEMIEQFAEGIRRWELGNA